MILLSSLYLLRRVPTIRGTAAHLGPVAVPLIGCILLGGLGFSLDYAYMVLHFMDLPPVFFGVWGGWLGIGIGLAILLSRYLLRLEDGVCGKW